MTKIRCGAPSCRRVIGELEIDGLDVVLITKVRAVSDIRLMDSLPERPTVDEIYAASRSFEHQVRQRRRHVLGSVGALRDGGALTPLDGDASAESSAVWCSHCREVRELTAADVRKGIAQAREVTLQPASGR